MFDLSTRVLIVDGMPTMRGLVVKACQEIGFSDISEANDGVEAWSAISSASPAFGLVISDWEMPNATGLDLLKRLRADSRFGKTPFILVTAEAEEKRIVDAARAGVNQYIVRPFSTASLREKIAAVYQKIYGGKH